MGCSTGISPGFEPLKSYSHSRDDECGAGSTPYRLAHRLKNLRVFLRFRGILAIWSFEIPSEVIIA